MPGLTIDTHPTVLATLDPAYRPLFERVLAVTTPDERIRALWLSGSLARGVSDSGSDLDLIVAIRDEDLAGFAGKWRDWLAAITPTLIARQFGAEFRGFHSMTTQLCRLDVVVEPAGGTADSPHRRRLAVFDRDGLDALVPSPAPEPGPDPEKIERLVEEFFRVAAMFPAAVMAREDWLLAAEGIHLNQTLLYDIFVEVNQPLPPMGAKQWSAKLTPGQREVFRELPAVERSPDSAVAAMAGTFAAFRTAGREAAESAGATWPQELDDAVTAYLDAELRG